MGAVASVSLDFETRSSVDLKKRGVSVYARHASTDVLCLAYRPNRELTEVWFPGSGAKWTPDGRNRWPMPDDLREWVDDPAVMFDAFNAPFERYIWSHVMSRRYGWPDIPLERWRCTRARALHASVAGDLDTVSRLVNQADAVKSKEGHRLMLKMSKPTRQGVFVDDSDSHFKLREYCRQDVLAETEAADRLPPIPDAERTIWLKDRQINERGVPVDLELCRSAVYLLAEAKRRADEEIYTLTGGTVTATTQVGRIGEWLIDQGVNVPVTETGRPSLTAAVITELLADKTLSPESRRVVELRDQSASAAVKKFGATLAWADADGRARETLQYYTAGTGRWGGKGPQFQNMKRGGMIRGEEETERAIEIVKRRDVDLAELCYPSGVVDLLANLVRSIITAPDGRVFVVSDFSGIEARVLAWAARHHRLLGLFASGADIYIDMATRIYDCHPADVTKAMRQIGKIAILGLGYGMGAYKFVTTAKVMGGVDITEGFALEVVRKYREANKPIVQLWYGLEEAAIGVVKTRRPVRYKGLHLDTFNDFFRIGLPSGRRLYYFRPKLIPSRKFEGAECLTYLQRGRRIDTYGGKLVENIVQAMSRCLLAEATLRIEKRGVPCIMTVHDEYVGEVPTEYGEKALRIVDDEMRRVPKWARGLPLGAESHCCRRYTK